MLADMDLTEVEFITKYLSIIRNLKAVFEFPENKKGLGENIDELSGYNNAIVDILSLLNEKYLYDQNW